MTTEEMIKELKQITNIANATLTQLNSRQSLVERYEDYECGWADGHDEVREEYENLVDDLNKLLRQIDIEQTSERIIAVSPDQKPLF